jgi:TP901 family phage tail tape measure protein
MADEIQSNIKVNIDTTAALASIKTLQSQISAFHTQMAKSGAQASAEARNLQQNLVNSINATGKFAASMTTVKSSAEQFTTALEKNKLSLGEYFRYAGASSKSFGKLFATEFETINKVARERVKDLQTQYIKLGRDANGAIRAIKVRPLVLDMENLATKTQIAAQRQQLLNQLLKQGSTNLLNFGKNTQWAGRQLMVGFTIPLAMAGTAAAKSFMEMEKAAIKFKRVYGDTFTTTKEVNEALAGIQKIATEYTKYGLAVKDTMDMAATAAATGQQGAKLLAVVAEANKLATLGAVDQQQALQTTISLTDAFGISADELAKKIDFLNAVENQTITSIEDLTIAVPKAAPVIKQLGGDVEDLTFFLTAMKEGGVNASEGANALKSGLASLINPTAKTSAMLKNFGIDITAIVEKDKGNIRKTVLEFASALDTLDPLNRARAIEQLFGKFQFSRLSTLFKNVADENSQANRVMELAARSPQQLAFISQKEMQRMQESTLYKFQEASAKMQAALAPVGEQFMKVVTPIIDGITKILDAFNNLPDSVKNFSTILVAGVAGLGPILLMTFGLVANGVANIIKLFANLKDFFNRTGKSSLDLGSQTKYMTTQQIEAAAVGASLEQVHSKLQQRFTAEAGAVDKLTQAYQRSIAMQQAFQGPIGAGTRTKRKGYASGGIVRGPGTGTSDSVPAMLSAGEAVIPAKQTAKYSGLIQGMIAGTLPGFSRGGFVMQPRMVQRSIGPQTQAVALASDKKALALQGMHEEVLSSRYANMNPIKLPQQLVSSSGNSFITPRIGGIYQLEDGRQVFVKPQPNLASALAEMRGTEIARDAHGLVTPKQTLRVILDPTDPQGKRTLFALESPLDDRIANPSGNFTKKEFFKQLVASLLRGDKDLGSGNLGGNVLADVGPSGVFPRATRNISMTSEMPSLEQQAMINLLGVKGGAKKWFAQSTSGIAKEMSPTEYKNEILSEIESVLPKLKNSIASMSLSPDEIPYYEAMISRLEAGKGVDWSKFQGIHAAVPGFANGKVSGPGTGTSDSILAMVSNGEAIIPAKQAKKYSKLVNGMIAGNIPGFKSGKFGDMSAYETVFPGISELVSKNQTTENELIKVVKRLADTTYEIAGRTATASSNTGVNAAHGNPRVDLTAEQARRLGAEMEAMGGTSTASKGLKIAQGTTSAYSNLTFPLPRGANIGDVSGKDLSKWVKGDTKRFMSMITENSDLDPNDPGLKEFATRVSRMMSKAGAKAITESDFENIVAKSIEQQSEGAAKQALIKARDTYSTFNVASRPGGKLRRESAKQDFGMDMDGNAIMGTGQSGYKRIKDRLAGLSRGQVWKQYGEQANTFTKDVVFKMIKDASNGVIAGAKKAAKIASPSKEGDSVGANVTGSMITGAKKKVKDAETVGQQITVAATQGMRNGISQSAGTRYIPGMFATDFDGQGGILQGPRQGTFSERLSSRFAAGRSRLSARMGAGVTGASNMLQGIDRNRVMGAGFGLSSAVGMASMMPGSVGQMAGQAVGPIMAISTLTSMFPGIVSGFGALLPALAPLAPALIGIGVAAAGVTFIMNQQTEARKKEYRAIHDLGNAAVLTEKKVKSLGDFFGMVPTGKSMFERTKLTPSNVGGIKEQQSTVALLQNQEFKKEFASTIESLKKSTNKEMANTLTTLTVGLKGQGFTNENIQTIVNALKQSSGKTESRFDVSKINNSAVQKNIANQITNTESLVAKNIGLAYDKTYGTGVGAGIRPEESFKAFNANRGIFASRAKEETFKADKAVYTTGANLGTMIKGFSGQTEAGTLDMKNFNKQFDNLAESLDGVKEKSIAVKILNVAVQGLDKSIRGPVQRLQNINDKLLAIKATSLGIELDKAGLSAMSMAESGLGGIGAGIKADEFRKDLEAKIKEQQKLLKVYQDEFNKSPEGIQQKKQERLSAAMSLLSKQEDAINKKYDERLKKLDEVQKANDKIAEQQRGQLNLADALSRGDISAAAGVVQDIRSQNAQTALEDQRASVDKARQEELASATVSVGGKKYNKQDLQEMLNALEYSDTMKALGSGSFDGYAKKKFANGGIVKYAKGGLVSYFADGGFSSGTDVVPAMLTPGEFVIKKSAVDRIGTSKLKDMNEGTSIGDSVYNYSINVNVRSDSNPDSIAQAVLTQIRRIDNQRVRGNAI